MLKVLERTSDSLLIRVPSLYERDIRNLFKRSAKKNVRIIEEDEATPNEIKVINEFHKSRLGKVGFSDLRSAREVLEEIRLKRK